MIGVVAVDELARAYRAAVNGEFRHLCSGGVAHADAEWAPAPAELVVIVIGCHGGAGASTVALGLAISWVDARVVECCSAAASGLAAVASADLGATSNGWLQGSLGSVLIERRSDPIVSPSDCPAPSAGERRVTIVDCGGDVAALVSGEGWLGDLVRREPVVVLVARPTVPGLRRLEAAAGLLGPDRVVAVLVGVEKRWPRHVEQTLGTASRTLRATGRLLGLPHDPTLAVQGLTSDPLPAPILAGCSSMLTLLKEGHR